MTNGCFDCCCCSNRATIVGNNNNRQTIINVIICIKLSTMMMTNVDVHIRRLSLLPFDEHTLRTQPTERDHKYSVLCWGLLLLAAGCCCSINPSPLVAPRTHHPALLRFSLLLPTTATSNVFDLPMNDASISFL